MPPVKIQIILNKVRRQPFAVGLSTTVEPKGASVKMASLKH
jgi:hypothetical protein